MDYLDLRKINVNDHVEKKGKFSYLSWAWAVDELLRLDQTAAWDYGFFGPPEDVKPYCKIGETAMVFCTVNAFGRVRTAQMPVLDYKNNPVKNIDSFHINTAMMRALAKAISLHGIGLYIYAGEDLPEDDENTRIANEVKPTKVDSGSISKDDEAWIGELATEIGGMLVKGDVEGAAERIAISEIDDMDPIYKLSLWNLLSSQHRSALKKFFRKDK